MKGYERVRLEYNYATTGIAENHLGTTQQTKGQVSAFIQSFERFSKFLRLNEKNGQGMKEVTEGYLNQGGKVLGERVKLERIGGYGCELRWFNGAKER